MRKVSRSLMLLAAVCACTPSSQSEAERSAAAARADSSAAGYDVGPANETPAKIATLAAQAGQPDSTATAASGAGAIAVTTTGSRASTQQPDGGTRAPVTTTSGRSPNPVGQGSTHSSSRATDSVGRGRDSTTAEFPPLDPALERDFLVHDAAKKTATFQLTAGDEIPGQVSFNGTRQGVRTLTVPVGWRVTIVFANRDPHLPHSATVVAAAGPVPEELPEPAFPRSHTVRVDEGLLEGDADEMVFVASRAGRYLLACGVLGHAQRGQWITLDVSAEASAPSYR